MKFTKVFTIVLAGGTLVIAGLTGCESSYHSRTGDRTEGRVVDDRRITSNVKSDLSREPVYKFDDIDVRTFNGVVQLSGFVTTEEQKRRAGEIAQQVPGVAEVQNAISLKPQVPAPTGRVYDNRVNDPNAPAVRR